MAGTDGDGGGVVVRFPPPRAGKAPWVPAWAVGVATELAGHLGDMSVPRPATVPTATSYMARLLAAGRADAVAAGSSHAALHLETARRLAGGRGTGDLAGEVRRAEAEAATEAREAARAALSIPGGVSSRPGMERAAWSRATRSAFAATALAACVRGDPVAATAATLLAASGLSGGGRGAARDRALALRMALGSAAP